MDGGQSVLGFVRAESVITKYYPRARTMFRCLTREHEICAMRSHKWRVDRKLSPSTAHVSSDCFAAGFADLRCVIDPSEACQHTNE